MSNEDENKLEPYNNKNWAMVIKAAPKHPLEPGTQDGELLILIQNATKKPRKLHSHIGLTYRLDNKPSAPTITSPPVGNQTLNKDTPVSGSFELLPGDTVKLTINNKTTNTSQTVQVPVTTEIPGRKMTWQYLPDSGWTVGNEYSVTASSLLEERESDRQENCTFKATTSEPSAVLLQPPHQIKEFELYPNSDIHGSYGGVVDTVTVTIDNGPPQEAILNKGDTSFAYKPQIPWTVGSAVHTVSVRAKNPTFPNGIATEETEGSFKVVAPPAAEIKITYPEPGETIPVSDLVSNGIQGTLIGDHDAVTITDSNKNQRLDPAQDTLTTIRAGGSESFTFRPKNGWAPDEHTITVTSHLGGQTKIDKVSFKVVASQSSVDIQKPGPDAANVGRKDPLEGFVAISAQNVILTDSGREIGRPVCGTEAQRYSWKYTPPNDGWSIGNHKITARANTENSDIPATERNFTVPDPYPPAGNRQLSFVFKSNKAGDYLDLSSGNELKVGVTAGDPAKVVTLPPGVNSLSIWIIDAQKNYVDDSNFGLGITIVNDAVKDIKSSTTVPKGITFNWDGPNTQCTITVSR
ncbi:hypothetical protein [Streptomyces formicae]|uniref:Uncharacterized protein n=1 Tax=Streptomyces formicae TaxID=1616117 RepID=A0ABY3WUH5_9ACTN|nr:hypothetical protein [Streptomyces formicae]UNM14962.1 hypothetical protein J4032_28970 [Streptomyces formicae]